MLLEVTGCLTAAWTTESIVLCRIKTNVDASQPFHLQLTTQHIIGTDLGVLSFDAPVPTELWGYNGPGSETRLSFTLHGTNFGATDMTNKVSIGVSQCSTTSWSTNTQIKCRGVNGYGGFLPFINTISEMAIGTGSQLFSYDSPLSSHMLPWHMNGPIQGTTLVTATGCNFGLADYTPTLAIGTSVCSTTSWTTLTSIACITPPGTRGAYAARLTITGLIATHTTRFTYDAPIMTYAIPYNAAASTDLSISVKGTMFGSTNLTPSVRIGTSTCETAMWTTFTSAVCHMTDSRTKLKTDVMLTIADHVSTR